jgi:hypothetical protein
MLRLMAVLALLLPGFFVIGCDSGNPQNVCVARDDVQRSLERLLEVNVIQQGTNALQAPLSQLSQDLADLADAAESQFAAESAALRSAVDNLGASISGTDGMSATERVVQSVSALQQVLTATEQLIQAVATACP